MTALPWASLYFCSMQNKDTTYMDVENVIFAGALNDRPSLGIPLFLLHAK